MNLLIDIGNSKSKIAITKDYTILKEIHSSSKLIKKIVITNNNIFFIVQILFKYKNYSPDKIFSSALLNSSSVNSLP